MTPYPEPDAVLQALVGGAQEVPGDSFLGAYLQGSSALGDADENSDVRSIVVTQAELATKWVETLEALHTRPFKLESEWQHSSRFDIWRSGTR